MRGPGTHLSEGWGALSSAPDKAHSRDTVLNLAMEAQTNRGKGPESLLYICGEGTQRYSPSGHLIRQSPHRSGSLQPHCGESGRRGAGARRWRKPRVGEKPPHTLG